MGTKLLEIKNYSLSIANQDGTVEILKDVDLLIERGRSIAILGSSGSGKSLLALSIMGIIPAYLPILTKGEILLYDQNQDFINLLRAKQTVWNHIRGFRIAMIFQDAPTAFNPLQKCGNQIVEGLKNKDTISHSLAKSRCLELMRSVGLNQVEILYDAYPHQLSGGQLQRMMVAMAIIQNPELIIADEPTSNLDEQGKSDLIDLIKNLQKSTGFALVYITHNEKEACKISDHIFALEDGKLTESTTQFKEKQNEPRKLKISCISDEIVATVENIERSFPLILVSGLYKRFARTGFWGKTKGKTTVLDGVDLQIWRKETVGLLGPSGSGKSTLGRLILNLEYPDLGMVMYNGMELVSLSGKQMKEIRRRIQIVYQNPYNTLNPRMDLLSLVAEPLEVQRLLKNRKQRLQQAQNLLQMCGIPLEKHTHYTYQLSGGQRQRVAIARAMILEPEFVVLDECVSSLDVITKQSILELLKDFQFRTGVSYLFIAHDRHLVESFADRIIFLEQGKLKQLDGGKVPLI